MCWGEGVLMTWLSVAGLMGRFFVVARLMLSRFSAVLCCVHTVRAVSARGAGCMLVFGRRPTVRGGCAAFQP